MDRRGFIVAIFGTIAAFFGGLIQVGASSRRQKYRIVQKLIRDEDREDYWVTVKMRDIRNGDIFRMFHFPGKLVEHNGHSVWVAMENAHQACPGAPSGDVWGVNVEPFADL
jgi:hypothetical protein